MIDEVGLTGPDPSRADSPAEFLNELKALRVWAGQPSLRRIERLAKAHGHYLPSSTTHEVLVGKRLPNLPRLEFVDAFASACLRAEGNTEESAIPAEIERLR